MRKGMTMGIGLVVIAAALGLAWGIHQGAFDRWVPCSSIPRPITPAIIDPWVIEAFGDWIVYRDHAQNSIFLLHRDGREPQLLPDVAHVETLGDRVWWQVTSGNQTTLVLLDPGTGTRTTRVIALDGPSAGIRGLGERAAVVAVDAGNETALLLYDLETNVTTPLPENAEAPVANGPYVAYKVRVSESRHEVHVYDVRAGGVVHVRSLDRLAGTLAFHSDRLLVTESQGILGTGSRLVAYPLGGGDGEVLFEPTPDYVPLRISVDGDWIGIRHGQTSTVLNLADGRQWPVGRASEVEVSADGWAVLLRIEQDLTARAYLACF